MTKQELIRLDIRIPEWAYKVIAQKSEEEGIPKATLLRTLVLKALKNEEGDAK